MVMEEQGIGKKKALGRIEVPNKVLEGGVETSQKGMDEDEALKGTTNVSKDQTKILEDSVCTGKDQDQGVGMDQFQHKVLKSSNEAGGIQDEVLNYRMDVDHVQAVVVEAGFDKDKTENNVLEDAVAVYKVQEKVLHGGANVNKVLNSRLHMDTVQNMGQYGCFDVHDKVLEDRVEVDKILEGGLDIDKFQDKVLKGGVAMDKIQDMVVVHLNTSEDGFVKGNVTVDGINVFEDSGYVEKVLDEVLEKAVGMDMVQNKKESGVDVDKSLDEVPKDSVLKVNADMEELLNGQEQVETMRCQVKITTRHNLQLRMVNHTSRDVHVRLLGHGERITGSGKEAYCSDTDRHHVDDNPIKHLLVAEITYVLSVNVYLTDDESFTQIIVKIE